MENILLALITIIALILPFLMEKIWVFFFGASAKNKKRRVKNAALCNYIIKENSQKISLLKELNFFKNFYTPA